MNRRKYPYTAISFVLIAMVVLVLFMMSDILFAERNNLTLLKGALSTEFKANGLYDGVSNYNFIATQSVNGESLFLEYMTILGFDLVSENEAGSEIFMYQDRNGIDLLVRKESFMGRYIIWDFNEE